MGRYPVRKGYIRTILALALALCSAAGIVFVSGWQGASAEWQVHGPLTALPRLTGPVLAGALLLLAGLSALLMAAHAAGCSVETGPRGLVLRSPLQTRSIPWRQVSRFRAAVTRRYLLGLLYAGTRCRYHLRLADGRRLTLDGRYQNAERLGEMISDQVTPHQARRAAQELRAGREVDFGAVRLHRQAGLRLGRRWLRWSDLAGADLAEGWLHLRLRDGRERRVAVSRLVNAGALAAVLKQVAGGRLAGPG